MEADKFDRLARSLGDTVSRRGAVRAAFGGLLAGIAGVAGLADAEAKKAKQNKKKTGQGKKGNGKKKQSVKTRAGGPPSCVGAGKECGNPGNDKQCCNDLMCINRTPGQGDSKCGTCGAGESYCRKTGAKSGTCCGPNEDCNTSNGQCTCKYVTCKGKCCAAGEECRQNQCKPVCQPKTCADYPGQCGEFSDGCNGTIQCGCGGGKDCCGGTCVNKKTDPNNCGQCGNVCPSGECENGECVPQTCAETCKQGCCAGETCKPGDSADFCGSGGNACTSCGANEKCAGGKCVCKYESCDGKCCADGEICRDGKCVENTCAYTCDGCCDGGTCKDGDNDGACGTGGDICQDCKALGKNGACVEGACTCKPSEVTCPPNFCGYIDDGCDNLVKCECSGGLVCGANDTCVDACKPTGATCSTSSECCSGLTCKDGTCGTGGGQVTCAKRGGNCASMDCCNPGDTCAPAKNGRHICVVAGATKPKCHHVGGRPGPGEKCCPRLHLEGGRCVINRWDHCDPADGKRAHCEKGTFCTGGRLAPHSTQVCVPTSKKATRKKQRRRQKRQNMKEKTGQNRPNRPSIKDRLKLKQR